jgi:hypothetical protein
VLPHLGKGASIINTSSVTAYKGSSSLLDYSATKAAQVGKEGEGANRRALGRKCQKGSVDGRTGRGQALPLPDLLGFTDQRLAVLLSM